VDLGRFLDYFFLSCVFFIHYTGHLCLDFMCPYRFILSSFLFFAYFAYYGCMCLFASCFPCTCFGKGPVLDIALLHDEHMLRSALQSRKWQLIGMR